MATLTERGTLRAVAVVAVVAVVLAIGACAEEEFPPPGSKAPCTVSPPTGCPAESRYCCTMEDSNDTYCVSEPLLGDEWLCGFDPAAQPGRIARPRVPARGD